MGCSAECLHSASHCMARGISSLNTRERSGGSCLEVTLEFLYVWDDAGSCLQVEFVSFSPAFGSALSSILVDGHRQPQERLFAAQRESLHLQNIMCQRNLHFTRCCDSISAVVLNTPHNQCHMSWNYTCI